MQKYKFYVDIAILKWSFFVCAIQYCFTLCIYYIDETNCIRAVTTNFIRSQQIGNDNVQNYKKNNPCSPHGLCHGLRHAAVCGV